MGHVQHNYSRKLEQCTDILWLLEDIFGIITWVDSSNIQVFLGQLEAWTVAAETGERRQAFELGAGTLHLGTRSVDSGSRDRRKKASL